MTVTWNPESRPHRVKTGEEKELVARALRGDDEAFEDFVEAHSGRMLAVARRILPSEEDAQDAVQDAFLQAFRSLAAFRGDSSVSTWLHRIVVNAALLKLRSDGRHPERNLEDLLPRLAVDKNQVDLADSAMVTAS